MGFKMFKNKLKISLMKFNCNHKFYRTTKVKKHNPDYLIHLKESLNLPNHVIQPLNKKEDWYLQKSHPQISFPKLNKKANKKMVKFNILLVN